MCHLEGPVGVLHWEVGFKEIRKLIRLLILNDVRQFERRFFDFILALEHVQCYP